MNEWKYIFDNMNNRERKDMLIAMAKRSAKPKRYRAHWQGRNPYGDPMAPTPRMVVAVAFGMAGVLVVSLSFASGDFPVALLYMPALYMAYVAGLLGIRARMLKRPIRTKR